MTADPSTLSRTQRAPRYAGIERVQFPENPAATRAFERIDETLRRFFGARSPFLERAVTWDELVGSGIVQVDFPTVGGQSPGDPAVLPGTGDGSTDPRVPSAPTGLVAYPAVLTVILEWDQAAFSYFGHTEVWRSATDNLALAVNIGETQSFIYSDAVGAADVTYYYWVRHISKAGNPGPFNAVAGVEATTGATGATEIAAGSITADKMAASSITAANAALADAVVTTAKIDNLAVTDAKIGSMSVSKLTAGSLAVGQYIQSANFSAGTVGFRINADGTAEFNDVTVRGTVHATAGTFAGALSAASGSFAGAVYGGSYTASYAWPNPNTGGFHLSASGLLIGTYNGTTGDYAYINADGSAGFTNITASGTITASSLKAGTTMVATEHVYSEAITIPRSLRQTVTPASNYTASLAVDSADADRPILVWAQLDQGDDANKSVTVEVYYSGAWHDTTITGLGARSYPYSDEFGSWIGLPALALGAWRPSDYSLGAGTYSFRIRADGLPAGSTVATLICQQGKR